MSAKLIFSDIDDTLINDDLQVTPKTRDAIRKQIIKGNIFVPTSARLPKGMMTAVGQILKVCPLIAYNGALALDETGRALVTRFFDAKKAAEICRYVDEQDNSSAWNIYSGYVWYCAEKKSPRVEHEEKIVDVKATPASIEKIVKLQGVHKALIMGEPEDLDRMQKELIAKFPDLSFVRSSKILLEVVLKGVSKASAVKILAQEYKVPLKDCIAFGDNYNDEEMLEEVGHPYLMGNAPVDLQKKFGSDHITLDNNHDGIAQVLDDLE
ncbi:Cof-type HAD-IIB family hydrolase [Lactobacillus ultunensis]|uniref:Cof-like hydrolase n=1 Tax=Lactobacillus ultunensis DSM 16047 TaxID=525365 RepID=C2ENZ2_9LACO|nr:Cof-type HAD-IIB family hydrolase [Lactobacillus ultunensis]EEJ71775.1 Cof-like hydrolase [Lactobacillus ultunensis DSM 16047]KRL82214.1 HAD superfamily hydrolase [Lactobacillus ultunensis DSM 16047]QQP28517.1 Cof-type HAD-IIB family hydrolase [Lactobacillus ultunensis]